MSPSSIISRSVNDTRAFGAQLAQGALPGQVFGLIGTLGMGKTELVRGFTAALNAGAPVKSPSFSLVNIYETPRCPVYHFDFYRLKNARELIEIGFDDYLYGSGICLVEWADMFSEVLPPETLSITFSDLPDGAREITLSHQLKDRAS